MTKSPSPDQVRTARGKLTQAQAAALVYVDPRTWRKWEGGDRRMPAATWELFLIKTQQNGNFPIPQENYQQ